VSDSVISTDTAQRAVDANAAAADDSKLHEVPPSSDVDSANDVCLLLACDKNN